MKRFKGMIAGLLVACSVFLVAGSAGAVSVWEVSDTANNDIHSSLTVDVLAVIAGNHDSIFTGLQEFGMYAAGDTSKAVTFIKAGGPISVTANYYNDIGHERMVIGSNTLDLSSSSGKFSFYFKNDSTTSYYNLIDMDLSGSTHEFSVTGMTQKVQVHDIKPAAVPIPAAVFLLGSGLAGLVGLRRRKSNA